MSLHAQAPSLSGQPYRTRAEERERWHCCEGLSSVVGLSALAALHTVTESLDWVGWSERFDTVHLFSPWELEG